LFFDVFENKYHSTRAAELTPKTFFIFYILKGSVVRSEQSIRHQNISIIFIFWKGVSCDTTGWL